MPPPQLPPFQGTVELQQSFALRPQISHVVFDFDGTLSWLRHGWPRIMVNGFREHLPPLSNETDLQIEKLLMGIVLGLNGKPTILQMMRFAELLQERGGPSLDPEKLRREYQDRLDREIAARVNQIQRYEARPDDFVVFGGRELLEKLQQAGLTLLILSSTIEDRVKEEADILQLTPFFGRHIYGGTGDPTKFSKMAVFQRLLREEGITGEHLLSFGDGPVELSNTKELGGVAIAVCSDEDHNGSGVMDQYKRRQLLDAGADAIIPDFRDAGALVDCLLGK